MVESVSDIEFDEVDRDCRRSFRCRSESFEALSVGRGSNRRRIGVEESFDSGEKIGSEEEFEFVRVMSVRIDDPDDGETSLFDDSLIWVSQDVLEDRNRFTNHVERIEREGTTAVCGGGDGGSLNVEREEVEVGEE